MLSLILDMANGSSSATWIALALTAFGLICIHLDDYGDSSFWLFVFAIGGLVLMLCTFYVSAANGLPAHTIDWYSFCAFLFLPSTYGAWCVLYLAISRTRCLLERFRNRAE